MHDPHRNYRKLFPYWSAYLASKHFTLNYLLDLAVTSGIIHARQRNDSSDSSIVKLHGEQPAEIYPPRALASMELMNKNTGGLLHLDSIMQWLAEQHQLKFHHIDLSAVDKKTSAHILPHAYVATHQIVCLSAQQQDQHVTHLCIASSNPLHSIWSAHLYQLYPHAVVEVVLALPEEIHRLIQSVYLTDQAGLHSSSDTEQTKEQQKTDDITQLMRLAKSIHMDAYPSNKATENTEPISKIVDTLLQLALGQQASDIHLEPHEQTIYIRFRIDGILQTLMQLPSDIASAVISRLKVLGNMDITEKRLPQDGRLRTKDEQGTCYEMRLSTLPTAFGEKMVLRLFNPDMLVQSFQQLGFTPQQVDLWQKALHNKSGLILVTGPTGSGKTTTLYSSLTFLANPDVNICTIEDPVELIYPNFSQMQVHHSIGLTFAQGLKAILRQDPDIIMVGEIRDLETAQIALQAALTGHLVLATLHTNDAVSAIPRLLDLGIPAYLIQATLKTVLAQRLLRRLCRFCLGNQQIHHGKRDDKKTQVHASKVHHKKADRGKTNRTENDKAYQENCHHCRQTGFKGRVAVYEFLLANQHINQLAGQQSDIDAMRNYLKQQGHIDLYQAGTMLAEQGITSMDEVSRVLS